MSSSLENQRIAKRVAALTKDPRLFMKHAFYTVDESDLDSPSKPYPYAQKAYLRAFVDSWLAHPLNIVEKSRGVMATWTLTGLHLHLAFTGPYRKIFVIAKDFRFAENLRKQLLGAYNAIPESVWPKSLRPGVHTREGELIFLYDNFPDAASNSRILTMPSGPDVLRGYTGTAIWMDEFEFQEGIEQTFKASKSTARNAGRLTITSTYSSITSMEAKPLFWKLVDDDIDDYWAEEATTEERALFRVNPAGALEVK